MVGNRSAPSATSRKYDIYRNIRTGGYSVRDRRHGRVVARLDHLLAHDVELVVSQAGRERVVREQCKNVHAFVRCSSYESAPGGTNRRRRIRYNPYTMREFTPESGPFWMRNQLGRPVVSGIELAPDGMYEVLV